MVSLNKRILTKQLPIANPECEFDMEWARLMNWKFSNKSILWMLLICEWGLIPDQLLIHLMLAS